MDYFMIWQIKMNKTDVTKLDDPQKTKSTQLTWSWTVAWLFQYV